MTTKTTTKKPTQIEKPKFVLKPNIRSAMLPILFKNVLILLIGITILSIIGGVYNILILIPISILAFVLVFLSGVLPRVLDYKKREYRFHSDKLEYSDGWWVINRHVVPYKKVTDITLTKTIWNRIMNTGTLSLLTAGSYGGSVFLVHVNKPERVYEYLQKEILKI